MPDPSTALEPVHRYRGHAAISAAIASVAAAVRTEHAIVGEVYDDGPRAGVARDRIACIAHHWSQRADQLTDVAWHLRYDDEYRLTDAGWRIGRRVLTVNAIETRPVRRCGRLSDLSAERLVRAVCPSADRFDDQILLIGERDDTRTHRTLSRQVIRGNEGRLRDRVDATRSVARSAVARSRNSSSQAGSSRADPYLVYVYLSRGTADHRLIPTPRRDAGGDVRQPPPLRRQWRRSDQCTPRQICPTWSAPIIPAARLRRSAKAPQASDVLQEIGGVGNAFGGLGHPGGDLTGSSDVSRGENGAQVRDQ